MAEPEVIPARDIGRLKAVDAVSLPKEEFEGTSVKVGDVFDVLLESMEGEEGLIVLSKRKADRMLNWQRIMEALALARGKRLVIFDPAPAKGAIS